MSVGKEQPGSGLSGCCILVVEDEYFLADDLARALEAFGAEIVGPVGEVTDAVAALDAGTPVHGAVLDINLRGEMVYAVASALQARNIPFVFATGYAGASIPAEFQQVPRWEKPFDPAALASALPALVSRAGLNR
jgi:CheY-like chemotaxis protein